MFFKKEVKEVKEVKEGAKTNRGYKIIKIWTKFMLDKKTFYLVSTEEGVTFVDDKLKEYDIIVPNFEKGLFSFFAPDEISLADWLKKKLYDVKKNKGPTMLEGECVYVLYYRGAVVVAPGYIGIYTMCYKNKIIYEDEWGRKLLTPIIKLKI